MFQALLEGVLQRILGEYVEAIDPKKLNLSVSVYPFLTLSFLRRSTRVSSTSRIST